MKLTAYRANILHKIFNTDFDAGMNEINAEILTSISKGRKFIKMSHITNEEANGPTPEGYNIMFLDSDQQNLSLENLALVSDYELLVLNRKKLISSDPELTETGINISRIFGKINDKRKEFKK